MPQHRTFFSPLWLLFVGLLMATPAFGQRELKVIPDPDPELERQTFQLADGLEVNLFAADPLLAKPIHINFDAQGRLWVASSEVYPHIKPGQTATDKILVLEDGNADGVADKTTVFADGLLIPTGVLPGDGGAYVANSTEMLHLSDTNGDGKADHRRVVLSGFGTEDTHHIIHTFRWGPDGMLYFNQSIYIHSHVETPWGVRRLNSAGIWQFRPETMQLEVFARGLCNPWGHIFDYWGQSFATDGAGGEGINYVFPGVVMFTYAGAKRVSPGLNPGSPKHCGLEVISGGHFPDDWRGSLVTNDFRAHRVCRFTLTEVGSGYSSKEETEIIKSTHTAFRPIDVKMGPDGALYIADWYNPIIQHGEVDFRDDRRDHTHGRIWRVTVKGRPLIDRPQIVGTEIPAVLDLLHAPEEFTRSHAKLELKARGASQVQPALADWVAGLDPQDPRFEHNLLEGLWTYQSLDVVEPKLLGQLLASQDHHVRAAATRVLSAWHHRLPNAQAQMATLIADAHPQVRLEAIRALAGVGTPDAVEMAMRALDQPVDRFIDHALWVTATDLQPVWLSALEAGQLDFGGNVKHLTYVLQAAGSPRVVAPLVALLESGKLPAERRESVLLLVAALGGPSELRLVLDLALAGNASAEQRAALLTALASATQMRKVRPDGDLAAIAQLTSDTNEAVRLAAIELSGLWKVAAANPTLLEIASAESTSDEVRQKALAALADYGDQSRDVLLRLSRANSSVATQTAAIAALAKLDVNAAAAECVQLLKLQSQADPSAAISAILDRNGGAAALGAAVSKESLSADAAKLAVRAVRSTARDEPELVATISKAGGISTPKRKLSADEMNQLLAEIEAHGDPARGELIFRREAQNCLKCHSIAGAGGRVGPDLVSIGASAQRDYLVESILDPSAKIKENYHALTVVADGIITSGVQIRETDTELVLRDVEDREVVIPLDALEARKEAGSIMPVGLADELTRQELVDLVRFLSELGKVGPYAVGKTRTARRWEVLADSANESYDPSSNDGTWTSVYSTVAGDLPVSAVPTSGSGERIVRCHLEVAKEGKIELRLAGPIERVWLDGRAIELVEVLSIELSAGVHTLTFSLRNEPQARVRAELSEVPDSAAQAQFVGGK
jgi:putative heme-binding domain-containing protein